MPHSVGTRSSSSRSLLFLVTAVYTILLITRPQEFIPRLADVPLLQFILLGAVVIWFFTPDKGLDLPQFIVLPIFLMCVWLSVGFAGWWGGIVPALDSLLPPILYFAVLSGCVRSTSALRKFSLLTVLCASVLILNGYLQKTQGVGWTGQPMIEGRITYTGIFNDPNDIGLLIAISVAFCIYLMRTARGRLALWVGWCTLGWLLYGVYLTDSRGTMLAILALLGLEIAYSYGKRAVLVTAAIAVPVLTAYTRLAQVDAEEDSAQGRVDAWYEGVQMLMEQPVFGIGWGNFTDYNFGLTAHNSLVLAMAELGLVGYTFWLAFVGLSGWLIFRLAFPGKRSEPKAAAAPHATAEVSNAAVPALPAQRPSVQNSYRYDPAAAKAAAPVPAVTISALEADERLAARSLLVTSTGFAVGAFFLSQSYKYMLFICCGLIVGRFLHMRALGLPVPAGATGLLARLPALFCAALASIVAMWLLIKILL